MLAQKQKQKLKFNQQGFTLIELFLVIAILVLVILLILIGLQEIKKRSRDTQRKNDLQQIVKALELYVQGPGKGKFPIQEEWACFNDPLGNEIDLLVLKNIIRNLPNEPLSSQSPRCYYYMSDGLDYKLAAQMEADKKIMKNDGGSSDLLYELYTDKSANWP